MTENSTTSASIKEAKTTGCPESVTCPETPGQLEKEFMSMALSADLRAMARAAGFEAALRIMLKMGGNTVYVPMMEELERALRDERIRRMHSGGASVRVITEKFRITSRTVYRVLRDRRPGISAELVALVENYIGAAVDGGK